MGTFHGVGAAPLPSPARAGPARSLEPVFMGITAASWQAQLLISPGRNAGIGTGCICAQHAPQLCERSPLAPCADSWCSGQSLTTWHCVEQGVQAEAKMEGRSVPGARSRAQPARRVTHMSTPPAGGFATFSSCFPGLCEGKPAALLPMSLSQPCLPVPSVGLTRILPHLYLGSQKDVLNKVCTKLGFGCLEGGRSQSA